MCTPAMLLSTIIGKTKGAVKTAIRILHNVTSDLTVGAVITLCDIHYKKPVLLDHLHHRKKSLWHGQDYSFEKESGAMEKLGVKKEAQLS